MTENMRVRTFLVFLFLLFCGVYLLPNFVKLPESYPFHRKHLNYGLDIQGGAHLVYGVDVPGVIAERGERMARAIEGELKEEQVTAESVKMNDRKDEITIHVKNEGDRAKVVKLINNRYPTTLQVVRDEGTVVEVKYFDSVIEQWRQQVVGQAIQVIRNRIDQFGVAEPVIAAQGRDRILIQLPGLTDPGQAKELINKTARLDFRIVDDSGAAAAVPGLVAEVEKAGGFALGKNGLTYTEYVKKINEGLKGKIPANTMVAFEQDPNAKTMEAGKIALLVRTDTDISGDLLEDAHVRPDQYGKPEVVFRFGSEGGKKFGALTAASIGKRLAIVLDQVVYSAPVIQSRIDREGQITLGKASIDEAQREGQLISTVLRAGALPAALQQMEERSVGPSLGADSISKGKLAGVVGVLAVMIFSCLWYRLFGVVASICLGLNVVGLLAVLSALGATLTLPGIAGITLTVGMAVDANVIIYERIKEEIARGVSMQMAIRDGFRHAWSAILDSNVTTAIAAAVLVYFGSGPVRGFGVTLIAGIVTTMITAVFVTRYLLDILVANTKPSKMWI
ncbi:MAG: protein translocase subunit SecD [Bdellovibrionales bacterium]|nr:protein translocase subunit SecD [Bdellovibrionales bacterium]